MRYAIIGSRTFNNYDVMYDVLERHYISQIVSGGAIGADSLASRYASEKSIPLIVFKPDWDKYPVTAGFVRNKQIIRAVDVVLAFWDGFSTGTKDSLDHAKKLRKKIIVINFDGTQKGN